MCEYDVFVRHFQMKYLFLYNINLKNIIFAKDWKRRQLQFRGPKKTLAPKQNFLGHVQTQRSFRGLCRPSGQSPRLAPPSGSLGCFTNES